MTNTPQYAALLDRLNNKTLREVNLDLVGHDGHAFALMGAFKKQARRDGWTPEDIATVITECTSGDYDHLLQTLITVCDPRDEDDEDDDETRNEFPNEMDYDDDDDDSFTRRHFNNNYH